MSFRSIVVGMDEGELARHAVEAGLSLARTFSANLNLVHAVPIESEHWSGVSAVNWREVRDSILAGARTRCVERLSEWLPVVPGRRDPFGDLTDHLRVIEGSPGRGIAEFAAQRGADLIVIGGHERKGLLDFGRTAYSVLHQSACPVWVQPGPVQGVDRILAPVDPGETSSAQLVHVRDLALVFGARVTLFHVHQPPYFAYGPLQSDTRLFPAEELCTAAREGFKRFAGEFDWKGVEVERRFAEGEPADEILALQDEFQLVAVGTHGRSGFGRMMMGSVAYAVIKHAHVPVLTTPLRTTEQGHALGTPRIAATQF